MWFFVLDFPLNGGNVLEFAFYTRGPSSFHCAWTTHPCCRSQWAFGVACWDRIDFVVFQRLITQLFAAQIHWQLFQTGCSTRFLPVIIESQHDLGWKGPYRSSSSNSPAMGRDTFHQTRLLKAPFNLALNSAREGAATASLGSLCQCVITLILKNFFLISNLNLPSFNLKPLPLVLFLQALVKSPSPAFL